MLHNRIVCLLPAGLLALSLLFTGQLQAQSSSGGGALQGTVQDSSGAVVPDAKISATHIDTGRANNISTNSEGAFALPTLSIGKYRIRIQATGMKTWEGEALLETGRITEVRVTLQPGQLTETVDVVASVIPLITTTDATEGSTLDSMRIKEIPVNGRDLNMLLQDVTPGVEAVEDVNGGMRVAGLMVYSTDYVQDGASSNNREFGGSMNLQGLESIGEVRVETSTSSAKYTRPTSVIVTTKGGTNQVRGSMYETVRNNGFGVARARQDINLNGTPYKTPKLIRNEFGGSIGGPVMLPTFGLNGKKIYNGKNRTFFFFSREGQELRQGVTRDFTVPTAAMRQGDFSGLIDSAGRKLVLYDPMTTTYTTLPSGRVVSTRLPFPDNIIPIQRMSALAKYIYGITPMPTDITNPLVTTNLRLAVPLNSYPNTSNNPTAVRLDHRISDKDNFFVKANWSNRTANFMGTGSGAGAPTLGSEANVTFLPMDAISGGLNWNHVFSNSLTVETLLNRTWQQTQTVNGPVQKDWASEFGLPNPYGEIGWPAIRNVGFMQYVEGDNRRALYSMVTNVEQNYNLLKGRHNIQFGFRWHHEKQNLQPDQGDISGTAYFNSLATAVESSTTGSATNPQVQPQTGYDAANFFLGAAARVDVGLKRKLLRVTERNLGLYLQDNWKVNSRLTLTPGVRWDISPAMQEKNDLLNAFDVDSHSVLLSKPLDYYYKLGATTPEVVSLYDRIGVKFSSAADLGKSEQIFPSNYFDIGPRLGFAYRMFDGSKEMVIRGGYGLYISPLAMRTLLAQFSTMLPFRATYSYNPNTASQSPDGIANYLVRTTPTVYAGTSTLDAVDLHNPTAVGRGVTVTGLSPNQPSLRIHEFNLALEKQLNPFTVFRVRFAGKHGVNADQTLNINPQQTDYIWYTTQRRATPTGEFSSVARRPYDQTAFADVRIFQRTGYLNTSTFSFEMERRFTKGLAFQAFYTITNAFRLAGNSTRDDVGTVASNYLPGTVPTDTDALNRFLFYDRDIAVPKHRVRWNWNYELPFGKGKSFAGNAPGWLNTVIGGWKFSGSGTVLSTYFAMPTNNWGEFGKFEVYGTKYKILDCRSTPANATTAADERCLPGYLYYNGYISERYINSYTAGGIRNGVFGLPADYQPAQKPVTPWPKGGQPSDRNSADYDTNVVYIPLSNGNVQRVNEDTSLHPWRNQYVLGPFNWSTDASLMKFFTITEKFRLRVNADLFNAFNTQGLVTPGSDGIASLANSYGGNGIRPRQLQLTMRLEW